jgi:hypothetical protein
MRVSTGHGEGIADSDDEELAQLERRVQLEDDLLNETFREGGAMATAAPTLPDPARPFDLELVAPRAVSIEKLYKLAGRPVPPDLQATLGPRVPILLYQGLTPFAQAGASPGGVWGLGYEVRPTDGYAHTIAVLPSSEVVKVASIEQKLGVQLSAGGEIKVPEAAAAAVGAALPGLSLSGLTIGASTDQKFALAIQLDVNLIKIVAGPVGAGGARWQLYRQGERLEAFQPLVQTLQIARGLRSLSVSVTAWVRRRGWFFGRLGGCQWTLPPRMFEVPLDGLDD